MGVNTKSFDNASDMITFSRASGGYGLTKVSYGDELVTNGDFSSSDGWTLKSNTSISGGQLTIDTTSDSSWYSNAIRSDINIVAGKIYYYEVDIESQTPSDQVWLYIGGGSVVQDAISLQGTGVLTGVHIPAQSTSTLKVEDRHSTPSTHVINSISIKEVTYNSSAANATLQLTYHPNDVPRIEYNTDGTSKGLLVEEARTNLVTYSEDQSQSNWANLNGITKNVELTTAPDGTVSAGLVVPTTDDTYHSLRLSSFSITSGQEYCFSVYVKSAGYSNFRLATSSQLSGLLNTSVSSGESVGNGWYRHTLVATAVTTSAFGAFDLLIKDSNEDTTFAGDGTSGIYIWGAQVEAGAFPTSYIKTTGATAQRAFDLATIPVSKFGYNQAEGSFAVEFRYYSTSSSARIIELHDGGNSQRTIIGTVQYHPFISGGANIDNQDVTIGQFNKLGVNLKTNDVASIANGSSTIYTDSSVVLSQNPSHLGIGSQYHGLVHGRSHIKSIQYYPRRLTDAQLQELTT